MLLVDFVAGLPPGPIKSELSNYVSAPGRVPLVETERAVKNLISEWALPTTLTVSVLRLPNQEIDLVVTQFGRAIELYGMSLTATKASMDSNRDAIIEALKEAYPYRDFDSLMDILIKANILEDAVAVCSYDAVGEAFRLACPSPGRPSKDVICILAPNYFRDSILSQIEVSTGYLIGSKAGNYITINGNIVLFADTIAEIRGMPLNYVLVVNMQPAQGMALDYFIAVETNPASRRRIKEKELDETTFLLQLAALELEPIQDRYA